MMRCAKSTRHCIADNFSPVTTEVKARDREGRNADMTNYLSNSIEETLSQKLQKSPERGIS